MAEITATIRFGPRSLSRPFRLLAGSSADVTVEFRDDAGDPVVVSGVTMSATRPDGAAHDWTEGALTYVSPGVYTRLLTAPIVGTWSIEAACTGPQPETAVGTLKVLDPLTQSADVSGPQTPIWLQQALAAAQDAQDAAAAVDDAVTDAALVYVIQGVGVPASTGQIPAWDDAPAINAGITLARALGFTRVATRGVVCRIDDVVRFDGMVLSNSLFGDIPESEDEWRQTPRWVLTDRGALHGDGAGSSIEDFAANHEAYARVEDGTNSDVDAVAMGAAMTHMIEGYGLSGINASELDTDLGRFAITLRGDGCRAERFRLFGFRRSIITVNGARCAMKHYRIDGGGTPDDPGTGLAMNGSGGAPDHGPGFCITAGIKKVRGVNAFQMPILAVAQDGPTGKTKITCAWVQYVRFPYWKAGREVSANQTNTDIVVTIFGLDYRQWSKKEKGKEITGNIAPGTGIVSPVVGDTYSDGEVDWIYDGLYEGRRIDADFAASFLQAGHRLVLGVDPRVAQLTPAGVGELDLGKRGHVAFVASRSGNADAFDYVVDVTWNAAFATAWVGGWLGVMPGLRIGTSVVADNATGFNWLAHQNKGFLMAASIGATNGVWIGASVEDAAEGENTATGNPWSVGYYLGPGSAGMVMIGGSEKSVGIPRWINTKSDQAVMTAKEIYGGDCIGVYVESGRWVPMGGFFRGGRHEVYLGKKGYADLSQLQHDAGLLIGGEDDWRERFVPPRLATDGPDTGVAYRGWSGDVAMGPTLAVPAWAAAETIADTATFRAVRGVEDDMWRLRPTTPGVTGSTPPSVQRSRATRQDSKDYKLGRTCRFLGADGNWHVLACVAVAGDGVTAATPPTVTDATVTVVDGNVTWLRTGRYQGPGAPIPDGTVVWDAVTNETYVAPVITWTDADRVLEIASVDAVGIATPRLTVNEDGITVYGDILVVGGTTAQATLTATTSGTTSQALTTDGTAAADTASGVALDTNASMRWYRLILGAQRSNGTNAATQGECAAWDIRFLASRSANASNVFLVRTAGLTSLAPDEFNDADAAALRVTVTNSGADLVVNAIPGGTMTGRDFDWTGRLIAEVAIN